MLAVAILIFSCLFFYFVGYRFYAGLLDRDIIQPDNSKHTPAHNQSDGVDFVPSKPLVLFGHNFASIAGAGPVIGPIIAMHHFGWAVTLLWILIGNVFIGAVHDYLTLMVSVRNRGSSIAEIAETTMGFRAKAVFALFLVLAMLLVIAVFGVVAAKTLIAQPEMVFPTFAIIPVSMILGWCIYRKNCHLGLASCVGVGVLILNIYIGFQFPVELPEAGLLGLSPLMFWFVILMIYAGVASVLPVQILLQPRDYLSTYILFGSLSLGMLALLWVRPELNTPAFSGWQSEAQGPVWPMLFVLVACGAVSGFHSLVAGGTTSKQLSTESQGRPIGYGGMLTEGVVAVMTVLLVGGGLYWTAPVAGGVDMSVLGFRETLQSGGWILAYGNGFGNIVHQMIPGISLTFAAMIAVLALNTFVLTTLDSAARITRFIVQESVGKSVLPLQNKYVATAVIIFAAYLIGSTEGWQKIWPIFGATNQLIAAVALFVISTYLIAVKKPVRYALIPAVFMLATTLGALGWQAYQFFTQPEPNWILGVTALTLIGLALFVGKEGVRSLQSKNDMGAAPSIAE
ncbi:MAG: carbon starvation protein A [Candidatus Nitrohelix vancouverensis]|uniref:Carbon starvation protein A n=1 Tax=Candidatus Nitrohelix vancouverensis TaxID=2705534 RepID=A0A7T0C4L9_9BACT|nr:MAG: carbon starvation protein A [Candidatus Nitrohelix vancouverensis]